MQVKKFQKLVKVNRDIIAPALTNAGLAYEANKIEDCGFFVKAIKCDDCGVNHFTGFQRCKSKFCALCNEVKAKLWLARLYEFLSEWLSVGKIVVFLNLTIRDREDLNEGLLVLDTAWRYITNTKKVYRKEWKSRFVGGLRSLEVVTGKNSGLWHPHYHCIVLKDKPTKDSDFLNEAWRGAIKLAGGGFDEGIYKIMKFSGYSRTGEAAERNKKNLLKSIIEAVKYMCKFDYRTNDNIKLKELYRSLKGKRQLSTWGVLYNIQKLVDKDLEYMSNDQVDRFVCQVCGCTHGTLNRLFRNQLFDNYVVDYSSESKGRNDKLLDALKNAKTKPLPELPKEPYIQDQFDFNTADEEESG